MMSIRIACGEQLAGLCSRRVEKVEHNGRATAGDAVDCGVAVVSHPSAGRLDDSLDHLGGVDIEDSYRGDRIPGGNKATLDRVGTDAGEHISAVWRGVDAALADRNLGKQVVDVDTGTVRAAQDDRLAREAVTASNAVDLTNMRRPHHGKQDPVAHCRVTRHVLGKKVGALGRTAPHQQAWDVGQHGHRSKMAKRPLRRSAPLRS